jgi:rhodanese-related sulfurtransferase
MSQINNVLDPLEIDVAWVAAVVADPAVQIVDVREPDEWESGHIAGSTWIQLDSLTSRTGEIAASKQIVVVCRSGRRSLMAAQWLDANGFSGARSMAGGLLEWAEKGHPLNTQG